MRMANDWIRKQRQDCSLCLFFHREKYNSPIFVRECSMSAGKLTIGTFHNNIVLTILRAGGMRR